MSNHGEGDWLTIGRFAQLSRLSISALRFYDDSGILKPASVQPETGYRRYSAASGRDRT